MHCSTGMYISHTLMYHSYIVIDKFVTSTNTASVVTKFTFAQVRASNGLSGEWSEPLLIPLFPELYPNCGKRGYLTLMTIQWESDTMPLTSFFLPPSFLPLSHPVLSQ